MRSNWRRRALILVLCGAIGVCLAGVGLAAAHESEPESQGVVPGPSTTLEETWTLNDSAGRAFDVERLTVEDNGQRVGLRVRSGGEGLLLVSFAPECLGRDFPAAAIEKTADGFELIGVLTQGSRAAKLTLADGSTVEAEAVGSEELPVPFFVAQVPSKVTKIESIGGLEPQSCPQNTPGGER